MNSEESLHSPSSLQKDITHESSPTLLRCKLCGFKWDASDHSQWKRVQNVGPPTSSSSSSTSSSSSSSSSSSLLPTLPSCRATLLESISPSTSYSLECLRCGLISQWDQSAELLDTNQIDTIETRSDPAGQAQMTEAARAYKFFLLSKMSPLIKDVAQIVVDYLIWYRGPDDFSVGDKVDAVDIRGKWCLAEVIEVDECKGKVLVQYDGWSKKWNRWISRYSSQLAPHHTMSTNKNNQTNQNNNNNSNSNSNSNSTTTTTTSASNTSLQQP